MFAFPLVKYCTIVQFLDDKAIDSLIYLCHGNESCAELLNRRCMLHP